jgi:hypothetical protein
MDDMRELVELLNEYGKARFGDQWWPTNAVGWLGEAKGERLEDLLTDLEPD